MCIGARRRRRGSASKGVDLRDSGVHRLATRHGRIVAVRLRRRPIGGSLRKECICSKRDCGEKLLAAANTKAATRHCGWIKVRFMARGDHGFESLIDARDRVRQIVLSFLQLEDIDVEIRDCRERCG